MPNLQLHVVGVCEAGYAIREIRADGTVVCEPISGGGGNADTLDGQHGAFYQNATNINAGNLGNGFFSAFSDLGEEGYLGNSNGDIALNDGIQQSNLNVDQLDGFHSSGFAPTSHDRDHGNLTGLTDDDHPQYFNLNQNEAVAGIPAFNGGTSGSTAPFMVDSNFMINRFKCSYYLFGYRAGNGNGNIPISNGSINANLNSDILDGQHGSFYQNATNINAGSLGNVFFSSINDLGAEGYLGNAAGDLAQNNRQVPIHLKFRQIRQPR